MNRIIIKDGKRYSIYDIKVGGNSDNSNDNVIIICLNGIIMVGSNDGYIRVVKVIIII